MNVFLMFYIVLWGIYFYNRDDFIGECRFLMNRYGENIYEEVIINNSKDPLDFYIFRVICTVTSSLFYLFDVTENIDINSIFFTLLLAVAVYKGLYFYELKKYHISLDKACREFPYYLNNLCILINNNPVNNAIYDSIELAPQIFKKDLMILVQDIYEGKKEGSLPYIEFSNKYRQISDLHRIMITLYKMKNDSSESDILLTSLNRLSNEKMNDANRMKFEKNLDKQALMPWLGFMWIGFLVIALLLNFDLSALGGM